MGTLTIDGIGQVEIGPEFSRLTPEQQNATVEEIVTQIRAGQGGAPPPAAPAPAAEPRTTAPDPNVQGMREELPTDVVERGSILPVGVTREGKATLALPEFLEGPRRTIMDLLEGKRGAKDISGKEVFELGALFSNLSAASGTGAGITRAAGERAAAQAVEKATPPAVAQTSKLATELAAETTPAAQAARTTATTEAGIAKPAGEVATANPIPAQFRDVVLQTPSGKTDATGIWFLDGNKPVYANATRQSADGVLGQRAAELDKFPSITGTGGFGENSSPITVWFKPGEQRRAENVIKVFESARNIAQDDIAASIKYHRANGLALGYPKNSVDAYISARFGTEAQTHAKAPAAAPAAGRGALHSTPETLAMRAAAKAQYKPLDEANVVVSPKSFGTMTQQVFSEASLKALDETLTPASMAVVKRMQAASTEPITLQSLNVLREVANVAAGSKIPRDREIADNIIGALDDFVMGLKSKDLMLGTEVEATAVAKSLVGARKTWSEMAKLEMVARLVQRAKDRAENRPSLGIENSLRTEFTNLMTNDREMRRLTTAERNAVRAVTKGATKKFARGLGRLAPTGPVSGIFAGGIGGGITTAVGAKLGLDPVSSAVVIGTPLVGAAFGGRKLAAVLTQRSIKNLEKVIKSTKDTNPLAGSATERSQALTERIAAALNTGMQAQAVQQPSNPDIVRGLEGARNALGGPPTIGGTLNQAMSAIPMGRAMAPTAARLLAAETGAGASAGAKMSVKEIDSQLEKVLAGTDWHIMDVAGRTPTQLKAIADQLPPKALELATARTAAIKAEEKIVALVDKELEKLLKGTGIDVMDVALRGSEGLSQLKHLIPDKAYPRVLELAAKRAQLAE